MSCPPLEVAFFGMQENNFQGSIPTFGSRRLRRVFMNRNLFAGSIPEPLTVKYDHHQLSDENTST
eukprot:237610-Amphidinium_carterae.1